MLIDEEVDFLEADYISGVERVRLGTVIATNKRAAEAWQRGLPKRRGAKQRGLTGAALEAAVMGVARLFPDNVVRVAA